MLARTTWARNVLPARPPFRFQGCPFNTKQDALRLKTRYLSTAVPTIPSSADDKTLLSLFDQPKLRLTFSPLSPTGLFGHPSITNPNALASLTESTLVRAQLLTERILRARESRDELLKVVKNLDRLSDMLCGVIDLAELIRNAHPDGRWVEAANNAYEALCEYMNVLNTHVGLYEVCK
jgi:intermediate peptidase